MHAAAHVASVVGAALVEHHQLIGVLDGQFAEHKLVHQAENSRVSADAERQRKNRHRCKERAAANGPQ